jgi:hypothetical protein
MKWISKNYIQKMGTWGQIADFFNCITTQDRIVNGKAYLVQLNDKERCYEIIEVERVA